MIDISKTDEYLLLKLELGRAKDLIVLAYTEGFEDGIRHERDGFGRKAGEAAANFMNTIALDIIKGPK